MQTASAIAPIGSLIRLPGNNMKHLMTVKTSFPKGAIASIGSLIRLPGNNTKHLMTVKTSFPKGAILDMQGAY